MPLNSFRFVLFCAVAIALYNVVPRRYRVAFLVAASVSFYADSSLTHALILVLITTVTFGAAIVTEARRTRAALAVSIIAVVLPLFYVKYYALLTRSTLTSNQNDSSSVVDAVLPLGISFFTLQAIAYLVDVHRGAASAERRFEAVALFMTFFPKLLAGPIERVRDLMPQLTALEPSVPTNVHAGLKFMLWGFFCKLVVADNVGTIVDGVLRTPQQESGVSLWIAFGLYAFQIYFDFMGYTNIAIGVARCFNIRLNHNFNLPYAATSLRDFWRRWHISLSTWFRDYIYIPLGGNATSGVRRAGQVLVVFLASGLWHGAALNFVVWGAFHGVAYWIEEQIRKRLPRVTLLNGTLTILRRVGQQMLTFGVVTVSWVFFRLSDPSSIGAALQSMAHADKDAPYFLLNDVLTRRDVGWFLLILAGAVVLDSSRAFRAALERMPETPRQVLAELAYVNCFCLGLVLLGDLGVRDFTYFGF